MAQYDVRPLSGSEYEALCAIWEAAFFSESGLPVNTREDCRSMHHLGCYADGNLIGGTTHGEMLVQCRGRRMRTATVQLVCIHPAHQAAGGGKALMQAQVPLMRAQGFELAALYPFAVPYYERFGFAVAGERWEVTIPAGSGQTATRKLSARFAHELDPVYRAYYAGVNGVSKRTAADWQHRMGLRAPEILVVGDPIEAYAWAHPDSAHFGEVGWASPAAIPTIIDVMRGAAPAGETIRFDVLARDLPMVREHVPEATAERKRDAMWRILDAPGVLAGLELPGAGPLAVIDELCPENAGPFSLGSVEQTVDIKSLTRAVLGDEVLSLLPAQPAICTEFF